MDLKIKNKTVEILHTKLSIDWGYIGSYYNEMIWKRLKKKVTIRCKEDKIVSCKL